MNIREGNREARKEYIVPDLYFESFVLSQSIAAGCSETGQGIVAAWNEAGFFDISNPDSRLKTCTEDWDDSLYEGYCYWSGSDMTMFLS